jgi:protein-tyrosine phosphatase
MASAAWLLTYRCYATWLPGDRRGYIERTPDGRRYMAPPRHRLEAWVAQRLPRAPQSLDATARAVVDTAIRDQCLHAGWVLHAVHVRTNHVHAVVQGEASPDRMMNALKARATRYLRAKGLLDANVRPWARHGSTVPLRTNEELELVGTWWRGKARRSMGMRRSAWRIEGWREGVFVGGVLPRAAYSASRAPRGSLRARLLWTRARSQVTVGGGVSKSFQPINFRDVGEMLGLWLDPSPIPTGRLLRGGRFDVMMTAADLGAPRSILNLRRGPDPGHLEGVRHLHVPAEDDVENYDARQRRVRVWLGKALSALASPEVAGPVYVHCTSGRDRTGVVIAAALLAIDVPRAVVAEEYMLSEGADRASIELAIDGILEWLPSIEADRMRLRAALTA